MPPVLAILDHLSGRIGRLEGLNPCRDTPPWPTGWPLIDSVLPCGGLASGALHEWCAGTTGADNNARRRRSGDGWRWTPPLSIAAHLAGRGAPDRGPLSVCWIGRRVWPSRAALEAAGVLARSVFIDAPRVNERLWACETLLRCGAPIVVVLDGSGMDLTMTRRVQLAANNGAGGAGGLALSLRPARELQTPSAAATRWLITPRVTDMAHPRWSVELVRCKGPQPTTGAPRRWAVEQRIDGTGLVCVSDGLGDGSGASEHERRVVGGRPDPALAPRRSA